MLHLLVRPIFIQVLLRLRIWAPLSTAVLNLLYQWGANIAGSWRIWCSCHTGSLCLWRHWHGLLGTKWQHSRLVLSQLSNIDGQQTGWETERKTVVCPLKKKLKKSIRINTACECDASTGQSPFKLLLPKIRGNSDSTECLPNHFFIFFLMAIVLYSCVCMQNEWLQLFTSPQGLYIIETITIRLRAWKGVGEGGGGDGGGGALSSHKRSLKQWRVIEALSSWVKKKEEIWIKKSGWLHNANKKFFLIKLKREGKKTKRRKKKTPPPPQEETDQKSPKYTKAKQTVQYVPNWKGGKLYTIIYVWTDKYTYFQAGAVWDTRCYLCFVQKEKEKK